MLDVRPAVDELIVVAAHGPLWIDQCRESLGDAPVLVVDTGSDEVPHADACIHGGHPTGAYRWAYEHRKADRYLFIQDSMTCVVDDPLPWFRDQWSESGAAVAWQRFSMQWDSDEQRRAVEERYPGVNPTHGVFGPVFYVDRASLDLLAARDLMPMVPQDRIQAQGSERAWAFAFAAAGLPVVGPDWEPHALVAGDSVGPFRKVFANRP